MAFIETRDGTQLFYKDWGTGKPLVFVHGWVVGADMWESQLSDFAERGFRCIAYDCRGCGRSDQPSEGYDYTALADDLAAVLTRLDLREVTLIGHSMGCGIIVEYLARHGAERVDKSVFLAPTTPFLLKTADNPDGIERRYFDEAITAMTQDRPHYVTHLAPDFFGVGLPGIAVSAEKMQWIVQLCFSASLRASAALLRTNTETDQRQEVRQISVPTLILHGDQDKSCPLELTGRRTAALLPNSTLKVYEGAAHGLFLTHTRQINEDICAFLCLNCGSGES